MSEKNSPFFVEKKTKVICTIGPASESKETIAQMIKAGMNVARLNFSHGSYDEHKARIDRVRETAKELGVTIAIALDTKGPEVRLGNFKDNEIMLEEGQEFTLTTKDIEGLQNICSISEHGLYKCTPPGTRILMNDGLVALIVEKVVGQDIVCHVENSGIISNHKSVNVPNVAIPMDFLSQKDKDDLNFGAENDIDFIFASFVRTADDIRAIRAHLQDKEKHGKTGIIAKIENHQGVANIDSIADAADGVMLARGDLAVEVPFQNVPAYQRVFSAKLIERSKIFITATQMLESMIENPRPTRAETSDVANAVFSHSSAIMLSGETAAGKYPVEAVKVMTSIAQAAEHTADYWKDLPGRLDQSWESIGLAMSYSACRTARVLNLKAIVALTHSGTTLRNIARFFPECPILARCCDPKVLHQMCLTWGVYPFYGEEYTDIEVNLREALRGARETEMIKEGDLVVLVAGLPSSGRSITNFVKIHRVGDPIIV